MQLLPGNALVLVARAAGLPLALVNHRGYYRLLRLIKRLAPESSSAVVEITPSTRFPVDLRDPYWARLLAPYFRYEPEIAFVLQRAKSVDYLFIDGGANFGYWSLIVSSPEFGAKRCIAVEAFPSTYQKLTANVALNCRPIECVHAALFSAGNELAHISISVDHADASMTDQGQAVRTTTIDQLTEGVSGPIIIKIDVEGAEIAALKGAGRTLHDNRPLIIYEDHGKDLTHETTRFVFDVLGLKVFFVTSKKTIERIDSLKQLDRIKKRASVGYNFFSTHPSSTFYSLFVQ